MTHEEEIIERISKAEGQLDELRLYLKNIRAEKHFSNAVWTSRQDVILFIQSKGTVGCAECLKSVNEENTGLEDWEKLLCEIAGAGIGESLRIVRAKRGIWPEQLVEMTEMALIDLAGKVLGISGADLLGLGEARPVCGVHVILNPDPAKVRQSALWARDHGKSRYIKVKLFGDLQTDLGVIRAVRSVCDNESTYLIGDVNCGYLPDGMQCSDEMIGELSHILSCLQEAGLNACEDPASLTVEEWHRLQALAHPLALIPDAPLRSSRESIRKVRPGMGEIYNIHPDSAGSLIDAVLLADRIREFGGKVMIGDDSLLGPSTAIWQQVAACLPAEWVEATRKKEESEFYNRALIRSASDDSVNPIRMEKRSGFGVELNEAILSLEADCKIVITKGAGRRNSDHFPSNKSAGNSELLEQFLRVRGRQEAAVRYRKWQIDHMTDVERQVVMETADQLCRNEFLFQLPWDMEQTQETVSFQGEIDWEYMPGEDPEFIYQMNRLRFLICLGQAYEMTEDGRYVSCFIRLADSWLSYDASHGSGTGERWRTLDTALRASYLLDAMEYFVDDEGFLSGGIAARSFQSLKKHAEVLEQNPRRMFSMKSNWGIMEAAGLYELGLALDQGNCCRKAGKLLRQQLQIQILDDGMQWEASPMYHNEVLMSCLHALRIGRLYGEELFGEEQKEILREMLCVTRDLATPAGTQPMTGDSDDTDVTGLLREGEELLFGVPEAVFGKAEKSVWLKDSGQTVLRQQGVQGEDWLYFRNGPLGGGHGHLDKLHIGLWLDGEEVLCDSGRYTYVPGELRTALKSAEAHNVPLYGSGYAAAAGAWSVSALPESLPMTVRTKGEYAFLEGAHTGYGRQGALIRRRVIRIGRDIYVIADDLPVWRSKSAGNAKEPGMTQKFHFAKTICLNGSIFHNDCIVGSGVRTGFLLKSYGKETEDVITKEPLSRHYNQIASAPVLTVSSEGSRLTTFLVRCIGDEEVSIRQIPVINAVTGLELSAEAAEGYEIRMRNQAYGLVVLHQEAGNAEDYNGICGHYGLGRVMVCNLMESGSSMTVLEW